MITMDSSGKMDEMHAWVRCADMMTRIKDELVSEAMVILDNETKSGNIKVDGSIITQTDKNKENDQSMFIINNLIKQRGEMHDRYHKYLSEPLDRYDSVTVKRIESLKKFLMSVDTIYILMDYANMIDDWLKDILLEVNTHKLSDILKKTSHGNDRRMDLLNFISKKAKYVEEGVISVEEASAIKEAAEI